jgi:thiamine pyrophosphokinase
MGRWVLSADRTYAADGAANRLKRLNLPYHAVIGDFDSVQKEALEGIEAVHLPSQDLTDCDKILSYCVGKGHQNITLTGIEGSLPDHFLASLMSCARSPLNIRIAFRSGLGWIVRPGMPTRTATKPGARVSLLPLGACEGVSLKGVRWPLESATLRPDGHVSISNQAKNAEVSAAISAGCALLFLETGFDSEPVWDI